MFFFKEETTSSKNTTTLIDCKKGVRILKVWKFKNNKMH